MRENVPSDNILTFYLKEECFQSIIVFIWDGVFKSLCEIWSIYYSYPNDVIAIENDVKVSYCISLC